MSNLLFGFDWINWMVVLLGLMVLLFLVWIGAIKISESNRQRPYPIALGHWFVKLADGKSTEIEWKEQFNNKMLYKLKSCPYPVAVIEGLHVWLEDHENEFMYYATVLNSDGTINHKRLDERRKHHASDFNDWRLEKVGENVSKHELTKEIESQDSRSNDYANQEYSQQLTQNDKKEGVNLREERAEVEGSDRQERQA